MSKSNHKNSIIYYLCTKLASVDILFNVLCNIIIIIIIHAPTIHSHDLVQINVISSSDPFEIVAIPDLFGSVVVPLPCPLTTLLLSFSFSLLICETIMFY